jgi:hypothetical protein
MELSVRTGVRCPRSGRSTYHRLRLAVVALLPVRERGEAHAPPQHPARASSHPAHWSVAPPECGAPPPPLWMPPWPASTPSDRVSGLPSQRASGRANTTTGTPPAALSLSLSLSPTHQLVLCAQTFLRSHQPRLERLVRLPTRHLLSLAHRIQCPQLLLHCRHLPRADFHLPFNLLHTHPIPGKL